MVMNDYVYVFTGAFKNRKEACQYSEPQWEPEPDESVSDEEFEAWEERNPTWQLRADLKCYLDSDFIETIDGKNRFKYLGTMLTKKGDIDRIRASSDKRDNVLVLIFAAALGGFAARMRSTPRVKYCGKFACKLE